MQKVMGYAVSIIISSVVFAAIGILLLYLADKIEECETIFGSFAEMLSPEIKQSCAKIVIFYEPLIFVWIFSGFTLTGFVVTVMFNKSIIWGVITIIAASIIALKLFQVF